MIASTPVGARRQPATGGHATAVIVPEAGHARAAGDALRRIPGVRTATWPVPAGRAGLPRVIEAAIAGVAVRCALAVGPVFGAAVAALAWALTPYGVPLAAVMGATVALTGGLFAGGLPASSSASPASNGCSWPPGSLMRGARSCFLCGALRALRSTRRSMASSRSSAVAGAPRRPRRQSVNLRVLTTSSRRSTFSG